MEQWLSVCFMVYECVRNWWDCQKIWKENTDKIEIFYGKGSVEESQMSKRIFERLVVIYRDLLVIYDLLVRGTFRAME